MAPDPLDFLDIDHLLSEEERQVRDLVREWVDEKVLPDIDAWFEAGTFPKEVALQLGTLGLLGMHLEGYGCLGANAVSYGLACLELEAGDSGFRSFVSVQGSLCMFPIWRFGTEEQKQRWLPRMATGEVIGCFGLDRGRLRQRSEPHAHVGEARRRRLGAQRLEDVDHERVDRGPRGDLGADRRRHPRVPRAHGYARVLRQRHPPQAVAPRERDVGAGARRCARARGRGARRRGDEGPALMSLRGAVRDRVGCHGRSARVLRMRARVLEDPRAVGAAHRRFPAHAGEAREHGDRAEQGHAARAAPRADEGRRDDCGRST